MSSIKPPLHEVLHYPEESRRMLMQGFADAVDRIAANNGRTDIELFQVCRALGEPNVPSLLSLKDEGLPVYRVGTWRIDCRSSVNGQPPTRHTGRRRNHKPHMKVSHCFETADSYLARSRGPRPAAAR